jgi:hypothetical protein
MANTRAGNVLRVDTSANFPDVTDISAIKFIGNTAVTKGEVIISKAVAAADGSGKPLWDNGNALTTDVTDHGLDITCPTGIYVTIGAHGAVLYLYLE